MNPHTLLKKYSNNKDAYHIVSVHSELVAKKVQKIVKNLVLNVDEKFLYEISILHDIGVFKTNAPNIFCYGEADYICHGIIGAKIMQQEGLAKHAQAIAHHIGVGLTKAEIINQNLPLPHIDLLPVTIEEEILAYADLFFSKKPKDLYTEATVDALRVKLSKYGPKQINLFNIMHKRFSGE